MGHTSNHSEKNDFNAGLQVHKTALGILAVLVACPSWADSTGDLPWGYDSAAGRCVVCHSLEKSGPFRVAPNLWGIVGAEKARDRAWYAYSPELIRLGGTWSAEDLDAYLTNASQFVPGSTKSIRVNDSQEREEIIEFLSQLKD